MSMEKNMLRDLIFTQCNLIKYRKVMCSKFMKMLAQTFERIHLHVFELKIK